MRVIVALGVSSRRQNPPWRADWHRRLPLGFDALGRGVAHLPIDAAAGSLRVGVCVLERERPRFEWTPDRDR